MEEQDPVAIELNVDAALVLRTVVGIDTYPLVLALVPNIVDWDDLERVRRAVFEELIRTGIVSEDGEVHPLVGHWLRCLDRPDMELAVRIIETGYGDAPFAMLRMSLVRCGDTHVLAVRHDDKLVIQPLFTVPGQLDTLSAAILAGMGSCLPVRFEPCSVPFESLAEVNESPEAETQEGKRQLWRELGFDATAARVLNEAEVVRAAEIVAYEHRDGVVAHPTHCARLLDTREGRIVVSPRVSADGTVWLRYAPGDRAAVAAAVAALVELLPGQSWFETSRHDLELRR